MRSRDIAIQSPTDGITLSGTYEDPGNARAAVLLLPGSGPQDRDETIAGVKPFQHLAHKLFSKGIAVARFDDRGVGGSQGDYLAAGSDVVLSDAAAQVDWLVRESGCARVGVVGHSQGALFGLRLARRMRSVTSVVLLGAAIRPGMEFMMRMREMAADEMGFAGDEREVYLAHSRSLFEAIAHIDDANERRTAVEAEIMASVAGATDADFRPDFDGVDDFVDFAVSDALEWEVRELLLSRPLVELAAVSIPVLAIWGDKDRHVDAVEEREIFDQVGGSRNSSTLLQGLNHLFQRSETGMMDSYGVDGEPMLEPVPDMIADWVTG